MNLTPTISQIKYNQSVLLGKIHRICRSALVSGTIRNTISRAVYKVTIPIEICLPARVFCNANHLIVLGQEKFILLLLQLAPLTGKPIKWLYQNDLDVWQISATQIHKQLGHHGVKAYCSAHSIIAHPSIVKLADNSLCSFAYLFLLPNRDIPVPGKTAGLGSQAAHVTTSRHSLSQLPGIVQLQGLN